MKATDKPTTAQVPYKAPTTLEISKRLTELRETPSLNGKHGERRASDVLRCNLTDAEKMQYGSDLASTTNDLESLENDKAQIVAEFSAKIKAKEAGMSSLANKIRMGYEMRSVPTLTFFDVPKVGFKTTYRIDTGEAVDTRPMDAVEKQHLMDFEEKAVAEESAKSKKKDAPKEETDDSRGEE